MLSPRTTQNFKLLELNKSHTNYPTLTFCPILKSTHSSSTNPSPNKQTPFNKFSKLAKSQTAPINYMHGSQKNGYKSEILVHNKSPTAHTFGFDAAHNQSENGEDLSIVATHRKQIAHNSSSLRKAHQNKIAK
jgi:hypothetical protein